MMRTLTALVALVVGFGLAFAAPDVETVISKIEEGRAGIGGVKFVVESETIMYATDGTRQTTSQSREVSTLGAGQMEYTSESKTMRGDKMTEYTVHSGWDGERLVTVRRSGDATPMVTLTASQSMGSVYLNLFPAVSIWLRAEDAKVEEMDNGLLRLSGEGQVMLVDPSKGYAVTAQAIVTRSPYVKGGMMRNLTIYKDFAELKPGVYYPKTVLSGHPGTLELENIGPGIGVDNEGAVTTRTVVEADSDVKVAGNLGKIELQPGWQVRDYVHSGNARQALTYAFRKGLTNTDYAQMGEEQLAEARKREEEKKAKLSARDNLVGNPHPQLAGLEFINGSITSIDQLKGKVVLIDFWATWCGPCRASIPHIKEWSEKYASEGFVALGISNEKPEVVKPFLEKNEMEYSIALNQDRSLYTPYGITGIPQFYVIDRDGMIAFARTGSGEYEKTEAAIKEALARKPSGDYKVKSLSRAGETSTEG